MKTEVQHKYMNRLHGGGQCVMVVGNVSSGAVCGSQVTLSQMPSNNVLLIFVAWLFSICHISDWEYGQQSSASHFPFVPINISTATSPKRSLRSFAVETRHLNKYWSIFIMRSQLHFSPATLIYLLST